jgi:hypothetical protein
MQRLAYAVVAIYLGAAVAFVVCAAIAHPREPLSGLPFAVATGVVALLAWMATKKGHTVPVVCSTLPFFLVVAIAMLGL